jgi:hypothetical protein
MKIVVTGETFDDAHIINLHILEHFPVKYSI